MCKNTKRQRPVTAAALFVLLFICSLTGCSAPTAVQLIPPQTTESNPSTPATPVTCDLSGPTGKVQEGDNVTWSVTSSHPGKAYWVGTRNGTSDTGTGLLQGDAPGSWTFRQPEGTAGIYHRRIEIRSGEGSIICQTRDFEFEVRPVPKCSLTTSAQQVFVGETLQLSADTNISGSGYWMGTKNGESDTGSGVLQGPVPGQWDLAFSAGTEGHYTRALELRDEQNRVFCTTNVIEIQVLPIPSCDLKVSTSAVYEGDQVKWTVASNVSGEGYWIGTKNGVNDTGSGIPQGPVPGEWSVVLPAGSAGQYVRQIEIRSQSQAVLCRTSAVDLKVKVKAAPRYYETVGHKVTTVGFYKDDLGNVLKDESGQPLPMVASIWYPTLSAGTTRTYVLAYNMLGKPSILVTSKGVSENGSLAPGEFPLVIFSHGDTGCGAQSIFMTEELARNGYVVVAPEYNDAGCSEAAAPEKLLPDKNPLICPSGQASACFKLDTIYNGVPGFDPGFGSGAPGLTTYRSWAYRYYETVDTLSWVLSSGSGFQDSILTDLGNKPIVGIMGHSLGGYTAFNMVGGWPSWIDSRISAVVLLSPWIVDKLPSKLDDTGKKVAVGNPSNWLADPKNTKGSTQLPVDYVNVPVLFQGGDKDGSITPWVCAQASGQCIWGNGMGWPAQNFPDGGLSYLTNGIQPVKQDTYFALFSDSVNPVTHFGWSNSRCQNFVDTQTCLASDAIASYMNRLAQGFLARHLYRVESPDLDSGFGAPTNQIPIFIKKAKSVFN